MRRKCTYTFTGYWVILSSRSSLFRDVSHVTRKSDDREDSTVRLIAVNELALSSSSSKTILSGLRGLTTEQRSTTLV